MLHPNSQPKFDMLMDVYRVQVICFDHKVGQNTTGIYHKLIMAVDAILSCEETLWFQRTSDSAGNTAIGQKLKGKTHPDNFRLVGAS